MSDEIARRFAHFQRHFEGQAQRAKELEAEAKAINAKIAEQKARVEQGLPESDACPDCWVQRGTIEIIIATRADDPSRFDRWECRTRCGFYFDVPA